MTNSVHNWRLQSEVTHGEVRQYCIEDAVSNIGLVASWVLRNICKGKSLTEEMKSEKNENKAQTSNY